MIRQWSQDLKHLIPAKRATRKSGLAYILMCKVYDDWNTNHRRWLKRFLVILYLKKKFVWLVSRNYLEIFSKAAISIVQNLTKVLWFKTQIIGFDLICYIFIQAWWVTPQKHSWPQPRVLLNRMSIVTWHVQLCVLQNVVCLYLARSMCLGSCTTYTLTHESPWISLVLRGVEFKDKFTA